MGKELVFKRSFFSMLTGIIGAPFAGLVVFIIGSFFTENQTLLTGIAVAVVILVLFVTVFGENIRVEVGDKELRYYKNGGLKKSYALDRIVVGYRARIEHGLFGNQNITLRIFDTDKQEEETLDCSPLGKRRFDRLFAYLDEHTVQLEEDVLKAE